MSNFFRRNRQDPFGPPPLDARAPPHYTPYNPGRPVMATAPPVYVSVNHQSAYPDPTQWGYASDSSYSSGASYATAMSNGRFRSSSVYPRPFLPQPYVPGTGGSMANVSYGSHYAEPSSTSSRPARQCTHQTCPGSVCQSNHTYNPAQGQRFLASNYPQIPHEQESWNQRRQRESRNAHWTANAKPGVGQYDWKDHAGPAQRDEWHLHKENCSERCACKLDRREGIKEREWIRYGEGSGRR